MTALKSNIYITGFSGTGKTSVGKEVSQRLGWCFVDTDDLITEREGKPIESIFADQGEARFREMERDRLASVADDDRKVVSTGGGAVTDQRNRDLMESSGIIVCLEARPETIYKRLKQQRDTDRGPVVRPMLADSDPASRIRSLKAERQSGYAMADWTVHTDLLTPGEAAEEVIRGWNALSRREAAIAYRDKDDLAAVVRTSSGDYPIWVGWDIMMELGQRVKRILAPSAAYIIGDEGVKEHVRSAERAMVDAGIPTHTFLLPPGEQTKTLETARRIYGWLADLKAERKHLVLAVGGGVAGDLAGFVAATYLRGMPFAQVPTSLLAMLDAAIGGKVAVDLPHGKNLVGAFFQPKFVLSDVRTLETLPQHELTSGWAEAIKHGLILDGDLVSTFERERSAIQALDPKESTRIIRRSSAIKADVVSRDEKETLGIRVLLNYGHTIGHALEAATGYGSLLHGEAVSVGMMGAAHISASMGMMTTEEVERQRKLLTAYGLPLSHSGLDLGAVTEAMRSDKKTADGDIRWVLLDGIGKAVTRSEVPAEFVQQALTSLAR